MSRIGKKPVPVPANVTATVADGRIRIKGPRGEVAAEINRLVDVAWNEETRQITVTSQGDSRPARSAHGLQRALIANMVTGVTEGYTHGLEVHGTGYTAEVRGEELVLQVGYATPAAIGIPAGLTVEVQQRAAQPNNPARLTITGTDKQKVGHFAAEVKRLKPPEPYNGKGVRHAGEQIRRKEGKAAIGTGR